MLDIYSNSVCFSILDLLRNGTSSVAGIYASLVRFEQYHRNASWDLLMLLEEMEQLNLVRSWKSAEDGSLFPYHPTPYERRDDMVRYDGYLPVTNVDELNYDEIGLWYMITDHGTQWADDVADSMGLEVSKYWAFRDEKESKTLTIYGEDQDSIDAAMSCWLNLNRQAVVLSDAQKNKAVPVMKTSNGRFLYHLLEFVYHYA